jgi:hypothetical protein
VLQLIQQSIVVAFFRDLFKGRKAVLPTPLATHCVIDPLSIPAYKRQGGLESSVSSQETAA